MKKAKMKSLLMLMTELSDAGEERDNMAFEENYERSN